MCISFAAILSLFRVDCLVTLHRVIEVIDLFFNFRLYVRLQVGHVVLVLVGTRRGRVGLKTQGG